MRNDLIVNFTPTGMVPTKQMTPHVPVSVSEIVEEVHAANEIGITIVHLHARDEDTGVPTYKKSVYGLIVENIRKHCPELVICISLSGRNFNEFSKRSEALDLQPDMGSLTLSSLNFPQQASVNDPDMIKQLATRMQEVGTKPELEVFDLGMINYAHYLIAKDLIRPPHYFNIILGNIAGMQMDASTIGATLHSLPPGSHWAFGGIGPQQLSSNAMAIALGGGVRVGIEDNIYYDQGRHRLATNIELIKRIHDLAAIHERAVMPSRVFGALGFYNTKFRGETAL
jgi:uncharacterized protein (DUF849 family)